MLVALDEAQGKCSRFIFLFFRYDQAPKNLDDDQVPRKFKQVQKGIENPNMKRKKKNTKLEQFEKNNGECG